MQQRKAPLDQGLAKNAFIIATQEQDEMWEYDGVHGKSKTEKMGIGKKL
jgi:hypothetical protein